MINVEFIFEDGKSIMVYDVHPRSQEGSLAIPPGAVRFVVWLGTK